MNEDTSAYWRRLLDLDKPLTADPLAEYRSWHRILRSFFFFLFKLLSVIFFPIKASGIENVPQNPPFIIASNHLSVADYPSVVAKLPSSLRDRLHALATKHFYDNPTARFFLKIGSNIIRIDTVLDFFPALRAAARVLRAGEPIFIAPEGTRSETGEVLPFKMGVGILAVELNVPVVPVYIKGTYEVIPSGAGMFRPGKISVYYGKPIDPAPYIEKKKTTQAYDVYKAFTEDLRARILELSK
jgi:1-acyl-sn-glycerol-3-phosphate acyltransferase